MDLASLSLAALIVAILVSCTTRINVGVLALALAWMIGVYVGGMTVGEIAGLFPVQLFLTLAGVTLLFSQARVNGTLERVAQGAVRMCRGHRGLIPIAFFVIALGMASIGAGNIATAALVAPMAMATAGRVGISAFLMIIMVGNGSNAGSLSPFAPTGVIVNGLMDDMGLGGLEWRTYLNNLLAHAAVAFGGYFILGGWRLFVLPQSEAAPAGNPSPSLNPHENKPMANRPFETMHWATMAVIAVLITGVIFFDVNVGMGAFTGAVLLALFRMADEREAIKGMPWNVILMVTGVTVLIGILAETGGLDLFADFLAYFSTQTTVTGVVAFVTGVISAYSSTSGVVLPAFLPTVPGLIERLGGGDPLAIASAMNVGSHLVDVSPLSTIGALCIAAAPATENYHSLFNKVLAWGMSMSVVGALVCYIFFGLLW